MIRIAVPRAFSVKLNQRREVAAHAAATAARLPIRPGHRDDAGAEGWLHQRRTALRFRRFPHQQTTDNQQPHDGTLEG
jgi:hypothetical protein